MENVLLFREKIFALLGAMGQAGLCGRGYLYTEFFAASHNIKT
jgi:hypothetical protein